MIHIVKGFGIVNKAEIDVFLELSCFFDDPMDVGNLISVSSAFVTPFNSIKAGDSEEGVEKLEEPEIKLPTSAGSSKKQESYRKTSISALLTMPKPLTVWITRNCGKF